MPAPTPPDEHTATKEDWQGFQDEYAGWVHGATDDELLAEMTGIPEDGRPLTPSEAWRYHQCELRRRLPSAKRSQPVTRTNTTTKGK